jgi:predicted nucleic-acid-binding Zn-ribbon protein
MNKQQTVINLPFDRTSGIKCLNCGNETFYHVNFLRVVPALLSPSGRQETVPVDAFQCTKCGTTFDFNAKPGEKKQKGAFWLRLAEVAPSILGFFLRKK